VGEHAAELEAAHERLEVVRVGLEREQGLVVALGLGQAEELRGILQAALDLLDDGDDALEGRALLADLLRPGGVVPDLRILEDPAYLREAGLLRVEVKDTSAVPPCARRDR
jgi:hypothetical protein